MRTYGKHDWWWGLVGLLRRCTRCSSVVPLPLSSRVWKRGREGEREAKRETAKDKKNQVKPLSARAQLYFIFTSKLSQKKLHLEIESIIILASTLGTFYKNKNTKNAKYGNIIFTQHSGPRNWYFFKTIIF